MKPRNSLLLLLVVVCLCSLCSCQGGADNKKEDAGYGKSYANEVKEIWEKPKRQAEEVEDRLKQNDRRAQDTMKELDE